MAISTLQRLSTQIHHRVYPFALLLRASSSSSSSAKVSDRIVNLSAIDPEGTKREVRGLTGQTLLKALANSGLIDPASHRLEDIEACSAECEVNIAEEWLEKLPPRSYDEEYILKRSSRVRVLNKHSRLGCQVVLTQDLQVNLSCEVFGQVIDRNDEDQVRHSPRMSYSADSVINHALAKRLLAEVEPFVYASTDLGLYNILLPRFFSASKFFFNYLTGTFEHLHYDKKNLMEF